MELSEYYRHLALPFGRDPSAKVDYIITGRFSTADDIERIFSFYEKNPSKEKKK